MGGRWHNRYAFVVSFSRMEVGDPEGTAMTRAVDRASQILLALASGTPRLGVSEISELVDVPKPTVYTMLRTLERRGLVVQEIEGGKYALGPAVLQLGNAYLDGSELKARSALWADMLARQADEAVWVGVLSGPNVVVVHHTLRPDDLVQILEVGAAVPWHACALGRAIVAHAADETQDALLAKPMRRLTGKTVTDPEPLRQELATTRTRGYAVESEEATIGDAGLAAPVFDWSGRAVGALGIVGPVDRLLTDGRQGRLTDAVRSTARALSRDLGAGRAAAMAME
jgi:DNA-binding IclR family transcriptional regulator